MARLLLRWIALMLLCCAGAHADEFRPAYLQLNQRSAETFAVLWKVPALSEDQVLPLWPQFPERTIELAPRRLFFADGAATIRWSIRVPGGLAGQSIGFPGLADKRIDVLVRVVRTDGTVQLARVLPVQPTLAVTSSPGAFEVVQTYSVLGIEHILGGVDHLLFVLALLLLVGGGRRLIATITAFTVAHSITLALATLGVLRVPGPPVEALIALSIVFVAAEIVHARCGKAGLTQRYPWLVAFTFGLLHGLGFAGALAEIGLPALSIPLALLFFNIGVEIGQLLFIGVVLSAIALMRRVLPQHAGWAPRWLWLTPPYLIGSIAAFWVFERIAAF